MSMAMVSKTNCARAMLRGGVAWTLALVGLGAAGCLEPSSKLKDPGADGSTGEESTTGDPSTTTSSSTTGTIPSTTSGSTGPDGCSDEGCACNQASDCLEGLYCDEVCQLIECGDGRVDGIEECDDDNTTDADGCDADCTWTEVTVRAGFSHSCALIVGSSGDGKVRCWGNGTDGRLGYGNTEAVGDDEHPFEAGDVQLGFSPIALDVGDFHVCVLRSDLPEMLCFGRNNFGQLGSGNAEDIGDDELPSAVGSVVMGFPVEDFTTGGSHSCAKSTGDQIRCWGRAFAGRLGYGNEDDIGDDERPDSVPPVQPGAAVIEVHASISHSCAILIDDTVRCWGEGNRGGLGYGNEDDIGDDELPLTTQALVFDQTPIQLEGGLQHMCVLLDDGTVRCWGAGTSGQHGAATTDDLGDDERADELPALDFGGEAVVTISAGDVHTCALLSSGDVRCWGANSQGQLGRGHTDVIGDDETPGAGDALSFESPVVSIDAGGSHTCVVLEDATVRCWGSNLNSQLGLPSQASDEPVGDDELPTTVDPVRLLK